MSIHVKKTILIEMSRKEMGIRIIVKKIRILQYNIQQMQSIIIRKELMISKGVLQKGPEYSIFTCVIKWSMYCEEISV